MSELKPCPVCSGPHTGKSDEACAKCVSVADQMWSRWKGRAYELRALRQVAEQAECLLIHETWNWSDAAKHSAKLLAEALKEYRRGREHPGNPIRTRDD